MDATRNQSGAPAGMLRYEEFEPKFSWMNGKDSKTLVLDVPEFKKENLKVQLDNHGRIRISGSRPVEDSKWIRFSKDFQVPVDCDSTKIRAKLDNNRLFVSLPLAQQGDTSRAATAEEEEKNKNKTTTTTTTTMNTDGNHRPAAEVVGGRLKEKIQHSYPTKSKVSNVVVVIILLILVLGSYIIVQRFTKQPPQQLQQVLETGEEGIWNWIAHPFKKKEV